MNQSISEDYLDRFSEVAKGLGLSKDIANKLANFIHYEVLSEKKKALTADRKELREVTEDTSDGYHTFKELYEFRKIYNAALFNEWASQAKYEVHKSKRHGDGEECFGGGWFIVMATLPSGQISNHYELKDWDLFRCEEREKADQWDGHTPQDVIQRLQSLNK